MSTNKNVSIRYQALDKCFRDYRHRYYIDDLIDHCDKAMAYYNGDGGVSRRQIFEDIKFKESQTGWNIPPERKKDGRKVYYRYTNADFSINKQPLTDRESQQLQTIILTFSRFRGLPSNEWVDEVISNLELRFNLKGQNENLIEFEQNPNLKGINLLAPIIGVISNRQALKVVYRNYKDSDNEKTLIVHLYYVKQYNNRWFLFALDNDNHFISNFALDRICSLVLSEDVAFLSNNDIDFEHYFDDVVGVTIPPKKILKETIQLRFTSNQFLLPYIEHLQAKANDMELRASSLTTAENKQLTALNKQIDECREHHERLQVVAEHQICFDLDDGVVVNYAKFGDVLAKIK